MMEFHRQPDPLAPEPGAAALRQHPALLETQKLPKCPLIPVAPGKAYGSKMERVKARERDTSGKKRHQHVVREDEKEDTE